MKFKELFEGEVVSLQDFKSRRGDLLARASELTRKLPDRVRYNVALKTQQREREVDQTRREHSHLSDRDLVSHYEGMAKRSGLRWHVRNAEEHRGALEDGSMDRDATIEAIHVLRKRGVE